VNYTEVSSSFWGSSNLQSPNSKSPLEMTHDRLRETRSFVAIHHPKICSQLDPQAPFGSADTPPVGRQISFSDGKYYNHPTLRINYGVHIQKHEIR